MVNCGFACFYRKAASPEHSCQYIVRMVMFCISIMTENFSKGFGYDCLWPASSCARCGFGTSRFVCSVQSAHRGRYLNSRVSLSVLQSLWHSRRPSRLSEAHRHPELHMFHLLEAPVCFVDHTCYQVDLSRPGSPLLDHRASSRGGPCV